MKILTANQQKVPTTSRWQTQLKQAFRDVDSLLDYVGVSREEVNLCDVEESQFPILVPRSFADRIAKGDPADPILAQVLSIGTRNASSQPNRGPETGNWGAVIDDSQWVADPVEDQRFEKVPGLLHKYAGRALLLVTGACAVHCRYCFRQNFDYSTINSDSQGSKSADSELSGSNGKADYAQALHYLREQEEIEEVILSGGDPLMKTDNVLERLLNRLEAIGHLKRLRIHTRVPVVLPARVTTELVRILSGRRLMTNIVLHINHAQELSPEVEQAVGEFQSAGMVVFNQAVLLNGVNDSFEAQHQLCRELINRGILPYYLHLLDRVQGAEKYLVEDRVGIEIVRRLRSVLPGYGVPRLVRESPGDVSKTLVE